MKIIGLIGGMSWESTVTYYQVINETIKEKLGGYHSAKILMYSVDFSELEENMKNGRWDENASILTEAAKRLERGGADFILICTNTMHKLIPQIQPAVGIPIIHIADAVAQELNKGQVQKVALLGTRFTMQQDFIKDRLIANGIEVLIPDEKDMEFIDHVIFDELCLGIVKQESKQEYLRIMDQMSRQGARGVILGCTEIGMLISQSDTSLPVFDTTLIHAAKAAEAALE